MRTLESYERELNKLRERHSILFAREKYPEMQRCGEKTIALLDTITRHFPRWREKSNKRALRPAGCHYNEPGAVAIEECGCCCQYHRMAYRGDCRADNERFADPEDAERRLGRPTFLVWPDEEAK